MAEFQQRNPALRGIFSTSAYGRGDTAWSQWASSEKESLAAIMERHNWAMEKVDRISKRFDEVYTENKGLKETVRDFEHMKMFFGKNRIEKLCKLKDREKKHQESDKEQKKCKVIARGILKALLSAIQQKSSNQSRAAEAVCFTLDWLLDFC
ncbi:MAG: hypothetical protein NC312_02680 [Bacteroides fragilis]|nr:hypothetical protein [Bacteroides fragilis]